MNKQPLPVPSGTSDADLVQMNQGATARGGAGYVKAGEQPTLPPAPPGDESLSRIEQFVRKYCVLPTEAAYTAVTLWVAHTHLFPVWDTTPRLALLSAEKGSGKTRVMEVLDLLCHDSELTMSISSSYLFRRVSQGAPTLLVDETDALFAEGRGGRLDPTKEDIRAMINSGYRRGAVVGRVEMQGKTAVPMQYPVFAPVALAGIKELPDTVMARSVVIWMKRRHSDEPVAPFRQRRVKAEAEPVRGWIRTWAESVRDHVGAALDADEVVLPDVITDRAADVWEPLLAVAQFAGGEWPQRAHDAALGFVTTHEEANTDTVGVQLLADIRQIFGDQDRIRTEYLLGLLKNGESMWDDRLDARGLARKLKRFGIAPTTIRFSSSETGRGYLATDFHDAWARYL